METLAHWKNTGDRRKYESRCIVIPSMTIKKKQK